MKNYIKTKISTLLVLLVSLFIVTSCSNDDSGSGSGAPKIDSVSLSVDADGNPTDLTPATVGQANNMYVIQGTGFATLQKIYFNDVDTAFNPTLVTDTAIFVTIDKDTPYENASSKLRLVTNLGSTTFDFVVAPPAPRLTSFNPINGTEDEVITIYGEYFLDPIVKVGTVQVPVITSSLSEIKIKIPADGLQKIISVTTISGTSKANYAIGTAIYDDIAYNGFDFPDWNNHTYESDGKADQGLVYIKKKMAAYDNLQGNWSWDDQLADYSGIRIAIRADNPGTLKLVFNGDWSERNLLEVTTEWTTFVIPWSELGNPTAVQNFSFQNFSKNASGDGVENTFYIDNIGYVLK